MQRLSPFSHPRSFLTALHVPLIIDEFDFHFQSNTPFNLVSDGKAINGPDKPKPCMDTYYMI